jgi:hypothetical protein
MIQCTLTVPKVPIRKLYKHQMKLIRVKTTGVALTAIGVIITNKTLNAKNHAADPGLLSENGGSMVIQTVAPVRSPCAVNN